ncbi:MAG: DUF3667 domain-containing protein, partial [Bacteroidales bacterium]
GYFCSNCGQPASAGRFEIKNIVISERRSSHQRLWQFGFLYTLLELIRRPGHFVREYIGGKRINHFHFIRLLLLLVVVQQILITISPLHLSDLGTAENREIYEFFEVFISKYLRIIVLVCIPGYASVSYLLFRRSGHNFAEHIVLQSYRTAGGMVFSILFLAWLPFVHDVTVYQWVNRMEDVAVILYSLWFFYQFFSQSGYRKAGLLIRSILATLGVLITITILVIFIFLVIYL